MKKDIEKKLINKNTKPTSMRILVYDYLNSQKVALSLSEIENHFEYADRITIYRTLKTFEEKGIVHSIQENNTSKYILCHDGCDEKHIKTGIYIFIVKSVNKPLVKKIFRCLTI